MSARRSNGLSCGPVLSRLAEAYVSELGPNVARAGLMGSVVVCVAAVEFAKVIASNDPPTVAALGDIAL